MKGPAHASGRAIRLLHLEDSELDHALVVAHLRRGALQVQEHRVESRDEFEQANRENLPLVRTMLEQVAADAAVLQMDKEDLMADFLGSYQDALLEIGFSNREIAKFAAAALVG
jgi:fatty aldehyde decarbonylase